MWNSVYIWQQPRPCKRPFLAFKTDVCTALVEICISKKCIRWLFNCLHNFFKIIMKQTDIGFDLLDPKKKFKKNLTKNVKAFFDTQQTSQLQNGMLWHSFGGAVMFVSLLHFIVTHLRYKRTGLLFYKRFSPCRELYI